MESTNSIKQKTLNVLGQPLEVCNCEPTTGWYRDGFCKTDSSDLGQHTVCCVMTSSFLSYSKAQGNDLTSAIPEYNFPGLKPNDHWCLCASRWQQAYYDGVAPLVKLEATEISTLNIISLDLLKKHSHKAI